MRLSLEIKFTKKLMVVLTVIFILIATALALYIKISRADPLPASIKQQIIFKVAYPTGIATVGQSDYKYHPDQKLLSYTIHYAGESITFQEQPAPASLGAGSQVYYPALGIHPYAQFSAPLGPVALTKFYQSGSLKPFGQSAVLATHGTLVIANTTGSLTNEQWKNLFESMKITK